MARKMQVVLTDDIDGSEASGTVTFSLDRVDYEIDLNDDNAQQLRSQFASWIDRARRVSGHRSSGFTNNAPEIRTWAKEKGYDVGERGRVSTEIRRAYKMAH